MYLDAHINLVIIFVQYFYILTNYIYSVAIFIIIYIEQQRKEKVCFNYKVIRISNYNGVKNTTERKRHRAELLSNLTLFLFLSLSLSLVSFSFVSLAIYIMQQKSYLSVLLQQCKLHSVPPLETKL
jgi:hypothetical protein